MKFEIIAELAQGFEGSMVQAQLLVKAASKAGADAAVKKGLKKVAKLRTKKDKLKADIARTSISDVTDKLLNKWKRSK